MSRRISIPVGERTYQEFVIRTIRADGTVHDSEPVEFDPNASVTGLAGVGLPAFRWSGGPTTSPTRPKTRHFRLERTVTTTATEWKEAFEVAPGATE